MHPNPAFRKSSDTRNLAFAREVGFGVLCVAADGAPMVSHVPFLLSDDGRLAEFHLVRSNPIVRAMKAGPVQAKLAVQGPHSYVSPDWYGVEDQVPTWNYIAVHLTGTLELLPQDQLPDLLARQSDVYESRLAPKAPWTLGKMTDGVAEAMMRQIVPCQMAVTQIDGTWKLSQNKPDEVRLNAAEQMAQNGQGAEVKTLAAQMHTPHE